MANITFQGDAITTKGDLPSVGSQAPDFKLVGKDLSTVSLSNFSGKKKILNIVPSLDTSVCALSNQNFKKSLPSDAVLITISRDTPFAQARVVEKEDNPENAIVASDLSHEFGSSYNVTITSSVLKDLLSRAVVVLDADNKVVYVEQVPEITTEPNYSAALAALS